MEVVRGGDTWRWFAARLQGGRRTAVTFSSARSINCERGRFINCECGCKAIADGGYDIAPHDGPLTGVGAGWGELGGRAAGGWLGLGAEGGRHPQVDGRLVGPAGGAALLRGGAQR